MTRRNILEEIKRNLKIDRIRKGVRLSAFCAFVFVFVFVRV